MKRTIGPRLFAVGCALCLAFAGKADARSRRNDRTPSPARTAPAGKTPAPAAAPDTAVRERPSAVTSLQLAFDVAQGHPGGRVVLTARLGDEAGHARDAELRLEPDCGVAEAPVRVSAGVYTARITLPTTLGQRGSLLVIASAGQAVTSLALPLAAGPAAALSVEAPTDLPADGENHPLWIGVTDEHGNPSDEPPRVTVARGELGEPVPVATGQWMVDYRPPRTSRASQEVVRVQAGAAATSHAFALAPVPVRLTLAPKAGLALGLGGPALAAGAEAGVWFADLPPSLGLVLGAMWLGASESSSVAGSAGELDLRTSRSWVPVTLSAAARQPLGARAMLTLTVGGGAALVSSRSSLTGQSAISESGWAPAAMAGLELAFRTRFGAPFVEARGGWIGDPRLDTVRGSAWPVMLLLGTRFDAY